MCLCMKWGWCDDLVEWVSCVFSYKVRMMWLSWWVSDICLCMKWWWCDDLVEWVSCDCVWSEDDVMMLLSECHVCEYKKTTEAGGLTPLQPPFWCLVSMMSYTMKWGWCDEVFEWVSCVCVWSEDVVMMLCSCVVCLSMKWKWCDDFVAWVSCVLVSQVRMMWLCCWVSVMCLCMK